MLAARRRLTIVFILWVTTTLATFLLCIHNARALHRKLSTSELISTFGVQNPEHVPEYRIIEPRRFRNNFGKINELHFTAWNSTYVIQLEPNRQLVSPHLKTRVFDGNITQIFDGLPVAFDCHFHGRVISHGHLKAAISDCGRLSGIIVADDHFLMLQTLPERAAKFEPKRHVIYKRNPALINPLENFISNGKFDAKRRKRGADQEENFNVPLNLRFLPGDSALNFNIGLSGDTQKRSLNVREDTTPEEELEQFCDINNEFHLNYTLPSEAKLDSLFIFPQLDPITLEIGLFLDSQLYEHFQREFTVDAEQHLTDFSLALINNVHVLYQQPTLSPNLEIVIVHFEMWKKQPAPLITEVHRNGQAQTLLDSFCRYQARINPGTDLTDPNHWDHGVLLTGYDIYHTTSSVAGVAPVGRMCDELFACSLVEGLHLGRSFVLAHEMGHNMGMVHDGVQNQCGRSCCLMSAVNGAGKTTWSTCSVREFNAFLLQLDESGRGNCLRDPAESIASHDHLKDGRLPGQRFTADQQCSYFWGRDYQVEIPNGRSYEDICRILWCGNSGSTISTAHPALEGSWCGSERWCHEGQCESWNRIGLPIPKIVDGQWSEWSSADKLCPITPCQVTGSIALKNQLRTCTNPAPNNGGRQCSGINVRGLVCGESSCESFSRQEFGDKLCTAIRNDMYRPDRQLSGLSFLHTTQPCKVWCHVRDSELIRNKGQFPNGSPCGEGQYCVSGTCLKLLCGGKAVVASDIDCPPDEATKVSASKWEAWSEWSKCSSTCGDHGVQKRARKCRTVDTECAEKAAEVRPCDPPLPKCAEYSNWGEWSVCTAKCGGKTVGVRRRERTCTSDECDSSSLHQEEECKNEKSCPILQWQPWGEWSSCSVTCGHGQRERRRVCKIAQQQTASVSDADSGIEEDERCEGEVSVISSCTLEMCSAEEKKKEKEEKNSTGSGASEKEKSANQTIINDKVGSGRKEQGEEVVTWGEWMSCSVSCGIGFQLREGLCGGQACKQRRKQARTCNMQDCSKVLGEGVLSEWSLWSACSRTCGQGFQYRHRKCLNSICSPDESRTEHRRCVLGLCPSWANWEGWSSNCESCSLFETRKRRRNCKVKVRIGEVEQETPVSDESCSGASFEMDNCEDACGANQSPRQPQFEDKFSSQNLRQGGRLFGAPIIPVEIRMSSALSNRGNYWSDWSAWSSCSRVCGGGRTTRTRKCRIALIFLCDGPAREEKSCNTRPCFAQANSLNQIPEWSEWSDFSKCSCFTLTKFRRRFCKVLDSAVQGFCSGAVIQQQSCEPVSCVSENGGWSEWSEWSRCSRECGASAHQIRNRMCASPLPSNRGAYCVGYSFDHRPCEHNVPLSCTGPAVNGAWSEWTDWSECSDSCLNGQRSRTRYCSNPRPSNGGTQCIGSDFELQSCSDPKKCSTLTSLLSNSTTAPFENLINSTNLFNVSTPLSSSSSSSSSSQRSGAFSAWSPWSACATSCGFDFQFRQRICDAPKPTNGGQPCKGLAYMTSICATEHAHCHNSVDGRWSRWSEWAESNCHTTCSRFAGIRTRTRKCADPMPSSGGLPCVGRSIESTKCANATTQNASDACQIVDNIKLANKYAIETLKYI